MNYYVDIKILFNPEIKTSHIMNFLYSRLHNVFVKLKSTDLGISFPKYDKQIKSLGDRLRIHGEHDRLMELLNVNFFMGIQDYVAIEPLTKIPNNTSLCIVRRVQVKNNVDRIRRRYIKRHGITEEEANLLIPVTIEKKILDCPWINLKSSSTGQIFKLFISQHKIDHIEIEKNDRELPNFNSYGLSKTCSLPFF